MDEQVFGKYRLVRRLAFGGMAEIFSARLVGDQGFEKRLVVKRILPHLGSDPEFVRMFIDEAVLAAKLAHPNVVQVYDFGSVDGVYFIAMEYVDGADLRRLLRAASEQRRALSPAEVAAIGEGMARGLSYAHALADSDGRPLALVHRDISPHNVMLSRAGEVKIMDFGIAKAAARATYTASGAIKGKLAYMAPEQAAGGALDKLADQFAVGLVLWECCAGERQFEGDSEPELLSRVIAGRVRSLDAHAPHAPPELRRIITRTLSLRREDRYADLAEVEAELAAFRYALGPAGAVRLSSLVEELAPRELLTPVPVEPRGTRPLTPPGTKVLEPDATPAATPSGWSASGSEALSETRGPVTSEATTTEAMPRRAPVESPRRSPTAALAGLVIVALAAGALWLQRPRAAALRVESLPVGARILLDGADTGLVTPASLPVQAGYRGKVSLALSGHAPWSTQVSVEGGEERVVAELSATVEGREPTTENREPRTDYREPIAEDRGPITESREPTAGERESKTKRAKQRKAPTGWLSLRSSGPWVNVFLGGKKIGVTPLERIEVPAGTHTFHLRNDDLERALTLTIVEGEHLKHTVPLP